MINFTHIAISGVGSGFRVGSQSIPLGGLLTMLKAVRSGRIACFRYSINEGEYSEWKTVGSELPASDIKATGVSIECITEPETKTVPRLRRKAAPQPRIDGGIAFKFQDVVLDPETNVGIQEIITDGYWVLDGDFNSSEGTHIVYDKSIFYKFFDSDDETVLMWAFNVLEKLYEPGIVPLYISRANSEDYNALFLATTQLFAYIVYYARKYRDFEAEENNERGGDEMLKAFIEGWGLSYNNIDTPEERKYLFQNWIQEFHKRGTVHIADGQVVDEGGNITTLEGELRRLVSYTKPNEFLFSILQPQSVGWCLGYSSPTWYGTETVPNVSKGWDYGPMYLPDSAEKGVGELSKYPILGTVRREKDGDINVFRFDGTGRVGITTENDTSKVLEIYRGFNYEVSVWVKAIEGGKPQNMDFGVMCYDKDMNPVMSICLTSGASSNSFFQTAESGEVNSPCKIPGVYYRLTGVVYGILEEITILEETHEPLYLNFENGRPLRFFSNNVRYMAPYITQNRDGGVSDIYVAGITVKPLNLFSQYNTYNKTQTPENQIPKISGYQYPVSEFEWDEADGTPMLTQIAEVGQGYLGQKNVIALYAQINSAQSKSEVEAFIRKYLVSYKNILMCTWLDYIVRFTVVITIKVRNNFDKSVIEGATVRIKGGKPDDPIDTELQTDEYGFVRIETEYLSEGSMWFNYTVDYGEVTKSGGFDVYRSDVDVIVDLDIPVEVTVKTVPDGAGTVSLEGSRVPGTEITLNQTPADGYVFLGWEIEPVGVTGSEPSITYHIKDLTPLTVIAQYELNAKVEFTPQTVTIPAEGGSVKATLSSIREWTIDEVSVDWLEVSPTSGNGGDNEITFTSK